MRIYSDCRDLMSEMGRELNSYGQVVKPKTYQNKVIEGIDDFITKEIICQQYCLTSLKNVDYLFVYTKAKEWADAEFLERIDPDETYNNPGEAWKLREDMWEQFLVGTNDRHFDYTYCERINQPVLFNGTRMTKLEAIIQLLKTDPGTRKAVLSIYGIGPHDFDSDYYAGEHRIPCSMYYDFLIRWNARGEKQLNIVYHQRSSDFCMHFGDDVYLAWRLMEYIAREINIKPGYLYHTIDSLHAYKKDWHYLNSNIDDLV